MKVGEALVLFRTWADDQNAPHLFADTEVCGWLHLAQQEGCRRARLIRDSTTPEVCRITLLAGVTRYAFHPAVLLLVTGTNAVFLADAPLVRAKDPHFFPFIAARPTHYWENSEGLVVYPVPTLNDLAAPLALDVYRLALAERLEAGDEFEVPVYLHEGLVAGALARAYAKKDADTYSPELQDLWEAEFTRWFGPRIDAAIQRDQRDKRPRIVQCGW